MIGAAVDLPGLVGPASLWGMTRIDVEALLVWTYRDQRADLVVGHGLGLHGLEAQADGIERHGTSACGCAAVERIQRLGSRVDGTGGCSALHEDAEIVHRVVTRLDAPLQMLVIRHARFADRPNAMTGVVPRPKPVLNGKGRPRIEYAAWDKNRHYGHCLVRWPVTLVAIETARLEYALWLDAIDRVAATLRIEGRLTRHLVTGPAAPVAPWDADRG